MTEREADLVMEEIEDLEWVVYDFCDDGPGPNETETSRVMLNHLYELHKHRDDEVYNELCYLIVKEGLPIYSQLWNALAEMQTC